jgi:hypothetical protein
MRPLADFQRAVRGLSTTCCLRDVCVVKRGQIVLAAPSELTQSLMLRKGIMEYGVKSIKPMDMVVECYPLGLMDYPSVGKPRGGDRRERYWGGGVGGGEAGGKDVQSVLGGRVCAWLCVGGLCQGKHDTWV